MKAGSSYLRQHDLRDHDGVKHVDRIEVRWPSGGTDVVDNVEVNQIITIVEGKELTSGMPFRRR